MSPNSTRDHHAEHERQYRKWAEDAVDADAKKSLIQMADYHARAGKAAAVDSTADCRMIERVIKSAWRFED